MSDDDTRPDGRIEPSVRRITQLAPAGTGGRRGGRGVLPPFSGLLAPGRHRPDGRRGGPALEYLTLRPLVVEHLRERTERETRVETVERIGTERGTAGRDRETDGERGDEQPMTVREFIREQGDEGGDTGAQRGPEADLDADVSRLVVDRPRDGADGRDRGRSPWSGTDRGADSPPRTALSVADPGGWGASGTTVTGPARESDRAPAADPVGGLPDRGGAEGGRPDLVLADRSPTEPVRGGDAARTGRTHRRPDPDARDGPAREGFETRPAAAARRSTGVEGRPATTTATPSPGPDERGAGDGPSPGRSGQAEAGTGDALPLALDRLEQPSLDRFVERLSDELARHERIERERRGR